jgi:TonB family protein
MIPLGLAVVALVWSGALPSASTDKTPREWQGALDLRRAVAITGSGVRVDSQALQTEGVDPGSFQAPRLKKATGPVYPDSALRAGSQGQVVLICLIKASGDVAACHTVRSVHRDLDRAASDALHQWKFEPARVAGTSTNVLATFGMAFRLK